MDNNMYYQQNFVNPLQALQSQYNQRLAQLQQQYPQYAQHFQQPQTQAMQSQPQPMQQYIKCIPVTTIEEAKAVMSDPLGSLTVFCDTTGTKIYTKQMNNNGISEFKTYILDEKPKQESKEIDYAEKNEVMQLLSVMYKEIQELKGVNQDEHSANITDSTANKTKSTTNKKQPTMGKNATDDK